MAPKGCPQRGDVSNAVRDIVGGPLFEASALEADGEVRETSDGFRLTLRLLEDGAYRERVVDANFCRDLLGVSAVVLGLHLKRIAAEEAAAASGATTREVNHVAETTSDHPGEQRPIRGDAARDPSAPRPSQSTTSSAGANRSPPGRDRPFWLALPQAGIVIGSLPEPAWTGGVSLGWSGEMWRMWVAGRYQLPQTIVALADPGVAAVVDKYTAEVGVSRSWRYDVFDVAPGVFAGVDYLVARSSGEHVTPAQDQQVFAFVGAGIAWRWLVSDWLSVALVSAAELPLSRPSLSVQALGEISRIQAMHGRGSLSLEWNF